MVYVKRLTLQGFKSFGPRRTTLNLEKGLVVITGPNGGGKSNIMDAIRFALGELSAHNLRVGRMSELVHDRPEVSHAKVTLTLDNSDGTLPIDSSEVTITRKIDRNGESEYQLNGRTVSRTELLTLLSLANIKPSGFNIVPQGSVVEIAEMSGVELRRLLEEVAGIGDYEKRRQEAEKQLEIAERNIAVAKASTKEVRLRVKQLEKERNQAYRRQQVENLLNNLKAAKLRKSQEALEKELSEIDSEATKVEEELKTLSDRRAAKEEERKALEDEWRNLREELGRIEQESKRLDEEKRVLEKRMEELRVRISVLHERRSRIKTELTYLADRLSKSESTLKALKESEEKEKKVEEESGELSRLEEELREAEEKLGKLEEEYRERRRAAEEAARRIEERRRTLEKSMEAVRTRIIEYGKRLKETYHRIAGLEAELDREKRRIEAEESVLAERDKQARELRDRLNEVSGMLASARGRLSMLRGLERRLAETVERAGATGLIGVEDRRTRILDALNKSGVNGVYGFLDDGFEADEDGWKLLETLAGGWLKALVVETSDLALKIGRIASEKGVSLRIIPLDIPVSKNIKPKNIKPRWGWAQKALQIILQEVSTRPGEQGYRTIIDGVSVYHDGRVEVSTDKSLLIGRLLTQEYHKASQTLEKLRRLISLKTAEAEELDREAERLSEDLRSVESEIKLLRSRIDSAKKNVDKLSHDVRKLGHERSEVLGELKLLAKRFHELALDYSRINDYVVEDLTHLERLVEEARAEVEERRLRYTELRAGLEPRLKRLRELRGEIERVGREVHEIRERIRSLASEERDVEQELSESSRLLNELENELDEKVKMIEEIDRRRRTLSQQFDNVDVRKSEVDSALKQIDENIRGLESRRTSLAIRRAQLEAELTRVKEGLNSLRVSGNPLPIPDPLAEELEKELEEELEELGMINQLAPGQYEEIIGNYKVRSQRIRELEAERHEILRFLAWVEGEKKKAFMKTFNKVSESFERFFSTLTGGQGWLRLENPENPFEGGVEMILRFPGKGSRSSRAVSGGEKSVAAVSLLLALQGLTPAEFYVFDEVDAHMDLQYSRRLAKLFSEMARNTQIIVISLKDVIAEHADQLIGVYMRAGESRAVKTRLEEVKQLGG